MSKNSNKQTKFKISAEGQDYLNLYMEKPWDLKELTPKDIKKFEDEFFTQMVITKLSRFVLIGPFIINVLDNKGNSREDIAQWIRPMLDKIGFETLAENSYFDFLKWGNYFYSLGVGEDENGHTVITEVRRLPPSTFEISGGYEYPSFAQGKLLRGVVRDDTGKIHYWQQNNVGIPSELENCYHVRSNMASDYIDGVPVLAPLYRLLPIVTFLKDGMMIANNRDNILFLQPGDNKTQTQTPDGSSVYSYLKGVLKSFSRTVLHVLPYGSQILEPSRPASELSLKSLDVVVKWIMSLYSSSDLISKGDGTLIGGSTSYEAELAKNFSKSNQRFLVNVWTKILNRVLEWNGYKDFKIQLIPEELKFKNDTINMQIASKVIDAYIEKGVVLASVNEVREKFGLEDSDEEFLNKSKTEWVKATVKDVTPELTGVSRVTATDARLNPAEAVNAAIEGNNVTADVT